LRLGDGSTWRRLALHRFWNRLLLRLRGRLLLERLGNDGLGRRKSDDGLGLRRHLRFDGSGFRRLQRLGKCSHLLRLLRRCFFRRQGLQGLRFRRYWFRFG
jgi:hypothetical protein